MSEKKGVSLTHIELKKGTCSFSGKTADGVLFLLPDGRERFVSRKAYWQWLGFELSQKAEGDPVNNGDNHNNESEG